jgi:hypothetical protein
MEHQLVFSKIHIIEWLRDEVSTVGQEPDRRRTGKELHGEILSMLKESPTCPVKVIFHRVSSRASFLARLRRIGADFRCSRRIPIMQIETHGDEHGIGPSEQDGLTWSELMRSLVPLNQETGLRLIVVLSACHGMWGIKMAQAMERAPFFALLGPHRKVSPGEIVRGLRAFYRKVLVERDGLRAMTHMNNIVDPNQETFRIFNCEDLFRQLWDWYLEGSSTEELIRPRLEEALARERARRALKPIEEERLRTFMRNYILDYPARFEESRRNFFMIDLCPSNHQRFNLVLKPGQPTEIIEASQATGETVGPPTGAD